MKTITIKASEAVYEDFRRASRRLDRSTSELIREAMEQYRRERLLPHGDLRAFQPRSLGRVLKPLDRADDLLSEMLGSES